MSFWTGLAPSSTSVVLDWSAWHCLHIQRSINPYPLNAHAHAHADGSGDGTSGGPNLNPYTCDLGALIQMCYSPHDRNLLYFLMPRELLVFDLETEQVRLGRPR